MSEKREGLHRKENAEDMSKYCPVEECGDCTVGFCDKHPQIYEGCTCKDCEEVREHYRKYTKRKERERKGWMRIN